jgi:exosortase
MNQTQEQLQEVVVEPAGSSRWAWWLQGAILAALLGFLYYDILAKLIRDWRYDDNYSHGFFVPLFSAFVVWADRKKLAALALKPSWFGLVVLAGGLSVLVVGVLGAELFLSRSSLVLILAGLILYFLGWGHFRALLFPWAVLFLMIPIPAIIFNQIAFPLQLLASRFASTLLEWVGVPVLREGNLLHLPAMTLQVVEACSGIRSLVSLGTLAVIYGYFLEPKILRRVALVVAAVPIAVAANSLRVMGTGLLVHLWDPEKALGFFHTFEGWVIFVLSLGMLFGAHGAMRGVDAWRGRRHAV